MQTCSRCYRDLPQDAFAANKAKASGRNSYCRECMSAYARARNERPEVKKAHREAEARRRASNPEAVKAQQAAWRERNPDYERPVSTPYVAKWRAKNPDKVKALSKRDYEKNKARYHANVAKRRARKHLAIAPWADLAKIKAIYVEAARRNGRGEAVHVDHVVPLQHPLVCGLHCEANLEIVPAEANWSKNNRHWPDMP